MEAITNEEIFDEELCGMVKFEDETKEKPSEGNDVATETHKAETKPKKKEMNPLTRNMSRFRILGLMRRESSVQSGLRSLPVLSMLCFIGYRLDRWNFLLRCPV